MGNSPYILYWLVVETTPRGHPEIFKDGILKSKQTEVANFTASKKRHDGFSLEFD